MLVVNPFENLQGLIILLTYICISFTIVAFTSQINNECSSEENIEWAPVMAGVFTGVLAIYFGCFAYRVIIGADTTPSKLTKPINILFWVCLALSIIFTVVCQFLGVEYINNCSTDNTDIQTIENMNRMQGLVWLFVVYAILGFLYFIVRSLRKKTKK